jgi:hypothetical protein
VAVCQLSIAVPAHNPTPLDDMFQQLTRGGKYIYQQLARGGKYSGPWDHWSQKIFYAGRKKKGKEEKGKEEKGGKKEKKGKKEKRGKKQKKKERKRIERKRE